MGVVRLVSLVVVSLAKQGFLLADEIKEALASTRAHLVIPPATWPSVKVSWYSSYGALRS